MFKERELTKVEIEKIIDLSIKAKDYAYCPYSKFRVGAALLDEKGNWYTGVNIENASYGGVICAERTAFVKAISEGQKNFVALGVSTDVNEFTRPCGICRQFMIEFGEHLPIYLIQPDRSYLKVILKDLLPDHFKLDI
ncbi:2355_t:CDS:2 [Funneliformis geosporum]|uniref:Cytidine deaminase n=1 Tax=Funneliformis geosporum TaxID=1117311 RepID=A0A9W4SZL8_9GLOM|nr:8080_t:CDS:2 [Funneliformis geosporum]CAI2185257.1 2355_t:CDS:2 [Funneliformis geosporum]